MDNFTLEVDDDAYRLVSPVGECEEPRPYSDFSTVMHKDRICAVLVKGSEDESELAAIKVYDVTDFPKVMPMLTASVRVEPTEFDYDDENDEQGPVVDVESAL